MLSVSCLSFPRNFMTPQANEGVFSSLLPEQFRVSLSLYILEIVPRTHYFCGFTVLLWLGGHVDCFQLFATRNKVAMHNLE